VAFPITARSSPAHRTIEIATAINLVACFTPVESPDSSAMAKAFVKTFNATMSGSARSRTPLPTISGWAYCSPGRYVLSQPVTFDLMGSTPVF
jgi:hypothetical protein